MWQNHEEPPNNNNRFHTSAATAASNKSPGPSQSIHVPETHNVPTKSGQSHFYIPGFSIDPNISKLFTTSFSRLIALITYKPPVGLVAIAIIFRLLGKGRIWKIYDVKDSDQPERRHRSKREGSHRSFVLDETDQLYVSHGGVQSVRRKLLLSVVANLLDTHPLMQRSASSSDSHTTRPALDLLESMVACCKVSHHPGYPRISYVRDFLEPYSQLQSESSDASILPSILKDTPMGNVDRQRLLDLCNMNTNVCFTDGLVRVCRDRLLTSSLRLARTQEYWKRRVTQLQGLPKLVPLDKLVQGDRMRLSLATAALEQELKRLGEIVTVLMDSPQDMEQDCLIQALRTSEIERQEEQEQGVRQRERNKPLHVPNIGSLTNKASQYYRDGTFSFRKMGNGDIRGTSALSCLLSNPSQQDAWMTTSREWTARARHVLCDVVRDTLTNSFPKRGGFNEADFEYWAHIYCNQLPRQKADTGSAMTCLAKLIEYVDSLSSWRRVGEGKELRLGDTFLADWTRRLDILGIPSSAAFLWVATFIHELVRPLWPGFRKDIIDLFRTAREIIDVRLIIPLRDIAADILNKNQGMMAGFGLDEESASLDRMLRDMGFGDGTESSRHDAFVQATKEYETDLQHGLIGILVKGRLVSLLLLQMQQLKVGLLSALADIDVLMQGNRINFQVMAAIPAIVIVYVGTRFFVRRLYNVRAKDLRPVTTVHADMTKFLNDMERIIFMTGDASDTNSKNSGAPASLLELLPVTQRGEWTLLVHRYLILLDYSSPPYPQAICNDIHLSLKAFGGRKGTLATSGADRNLVALQRIQHKHDKLTKFL